MKSSLLLVNLSFLFLSLMSFAQKSPSVVDKPDSTTQSPAETSTGGAESLAQVEASPTTTETPQAEAPKEGEDLLSGIIEDYVYNPSNKRDPFLPFEPVTTENNMLGPVFPLQKFDIDQLKLVGIVWNVIDPKAMIVDPSGKGYVVRKDERIGRHNGIVAKIRENEIIIIEQLKSSAAGAPTNVTRFLRLSNE